MAEQKKDTPTKASRPEDKPGTTPSGRADRPTPEGEAAKQEKRADSSDAKQAAPSRNRQPASESSDPAVHQLLAEQDIARQNDDEDEVKRTQDALAELGYE